MTTAVLNLSEMASKLHAYLKQTGGAWESDCLKHLFPNPHKYVSGKDNSDHWQYEANAYGSTQERVYLKQGETFLFKTFSPTEKVSYSSQVSAAYQKLRKAGMADERNNGYNCYVFYAK